MKYLHRIFAIFFLLPTIAFAQKAGHKTLPPIIELNKETGLVKVNGKPQFLILSKNRVAWEADYAIENLDHEQLAYFRLSKGFHYSNTVHNHDEVQYFVLTFTHSGAHCDIRDFMNSSTIIKSLATLVVKKKLVKDAQIDEAQEKKLIDENRGFSTTEYGDSTKKELANNTKSEYDTLTGKITMKDNFIYYNQQSIGTYTKTDIDTDLELIQVYAINRYKIAEITHALGDKDWTIITVVDQDRKTLKYDADKPLETLFMFLLKKKYL